MSLAISEREGGGGRWWPRLGADAAATREAARASRPLLLSDVAGRADGRSRLWRQRLLEIATAVALRPRVLLLDEPAAGVPEEERHEILAIVKALPADVTILSSSTTWTSSSPSPTASRCCVAGALLTEGTVAEIAADARVRTAYLGEGEDV